MRTERPTALQETTQRFAAAQQLVQRTADELRQISGLDVERAELYLLTGIGMQLANALRDVADHLAGKTMVVGVRNPRENQPSGLPDAHRKLHLARKKLGEAAADLHGAGTFLFVPDGEADPESSGEFIPDEPAAG
jgi:hypothetical protein